MSCLVIFVIICKEAKSSIFVLIASKLDLYNPPASGKRIY